jgi:hypothetical protein
LLPYRDKRAFNFGKLDEIGLKEQTFTDPKKQPWIENITLNFNNSKTDSNNDLVATGTLRAEYHNNPAALADITASVVGGATSIGLSDAGDDFIVRRIEGAGYNDRKPVDPGTGGAVGPDKKYSKNAAVSSMNYAVFFHDKEAIHAGSLDIGSHACVHVDWTDLHTIRQINYHSVEGRTKVHVSYDSGALKTLCCSRMQFLRVKKKGDAPNPCRKADPKACP